MRALIQRVKEAHVVADGVLSGQIQGGMLVFLGFTHDDDMQKGQKLLQKLKSMRIFSDENGKLNLNLEQAQSNILIVSQFTLYGSLTHGNRPGFDEALEPSRAKALYDELVRRAHEFFPDLQTGEFGADMQVSLINDGPCTFMLEY